MIRLKNFLNSVSLLIILIFLISHNIYCQSLQCLNHKKCLESNYLLETTQSSSKPQLNSSIYECSCDPKRCHIYGECCIDAELNTNLISINKHSCITVDTTSKTKVSFYAISQCDDLWSVESEIKQNRYDIQHTKSECENHNKRDLLLNVPVTSRITNITYKNFFCAVCNFDIASPGFWNTSTFCPTDYPHSCINAFDSPSLQSIPNCASDRMIDQCTDDSSYEQRLNCSLYLAPIKATQHFTPLSFKNQYCANCYSNALKNINCLTRSYSPQTEFEGYSLSFSVVLDINFKGKVGARNTCNDTHIYDPWKRICRRVYCRENSVLVDGKCVETNNKTNNSTNEFSICPKILIDPEEYMLLHNGTVLVIDSEKVYNYSEYELDSSTKLLKICSYAQNITYLKEKFPESDSYLTIGCLTISIISLSIKISIFFLRPEPRRISSILVLFLSISLIMAQMLFLFGINRTETKSICRWIAISMHYFFLSSFFWMNVLSYDINRTFSAMKMPKTSKVMSTQLLIYTLYGWTLPLIIITVAVVVDQVIDDNLEFDISPRYGTTYCWIANRLALTVYLAVPLAILLIINGVLLLFTAIKIRNVSESTRFARENTKQRNERFRFILYLKLATIMGITWIIGFFAAYIENRFIWGLFIVLNSLQGLYVLLAFTHCPNFDLWHSCRSGTERRISHKSFSTSSVTNTCTKL